MSPSVINRYDDQNDGPDGSCRLTSMLHTRRYVCTVQCLALAGTGCAQTIPAASSAHKACSSMAGCRCAWCGERASSAAAQRGRRRRPSKRKWRGTSAPADHQELAGAGGEAGFRLASIFILHRVAAFCHSRRGVGASTHCGTEHSLRGPRNRRTSTSSCQRLLLPPSQLVRAKLLNTVLILN